MPRPQGERLTELLHDGSAGNSAQAAREKRWAQSVLARLPSKDECLARVPERHRELASRWFDEVTRMAGQECDVDDAPKGVS